MADVVFPDWSSLSSAVDANQAQELVPGLLLALKAAQHAAGDGAAGRLLDSAHDHA